MRRHFTLARVLTKATPLACLLVLSVCGVAGAKDSACTATGKPGRYVVRVGDEHGTRTRLGPVRRGSARQQFSFTLPRGATQGPALWYTIALNYRIQFSPHSKAGFVWVTTDTQGAMSGQIEYVLSQSNKGLAIRGSSVAVNKGLRKWRVHDQADQVAYSNYLPYRGVQGGKNTLTVRAEVTEGVEVESLEILGQTGVKVTPVSPYPLKLSLHVQGAQPLEVGTTFTVLAEMRNTAHVNAGTVTINGPLFDGQGLVLLSTPQRVIARGSNYGTWRLRFRAKRAGAYSIVLGINSLCNRPATMTRVAVR
jgi:hypothetical protein